MKENLLDSAQLLALSRLLSYPDRWPEDRGLALLAAGNRQAPDITQPRNLASLQADYVRLFVNALPEVCCPPYGSFYLEGTLMGESTVRIDRLYAEYGFQSDELADHIAVELEFLALLAALASNAAVRQDYEFILEHLQRWTPEFFTRLGQIDATGFYGGIARFAEAFLMLRQESPSFDAINAGPHRRHAPGGRGC